MDADSQPATDPTAASNATAPPSSLQASELPSAPGVAPGVAPPTVSLAPVSLAPSYWLPLAISLAGAVCVPLQAHGAGFRWLALLLVAFGGFLLLQARWLRLEFAEEDLVVWRGEQEIRRFAYASWLTWRLFWPALPVLFTFREVRSIHLLPVLFDAHELRQQLQRRLPQLSPPAAP